MYLSKLKIENNLLVYTVALYQESVVSSVIQATGTVEIEDGLWIGNHLKAQNGLQRVYTIPGAQPGAVCTPGFLQGQTEFQSAWVGMAAWCPVRRLVQFPAAAVLGLTWLKEVLRNVCSVPECEKKSLMGYPLLPSGRCPFKQNKK